MNLYLQYGIVAIAVGMAGWTTWRILRGRRVFRRGAKPADAGGCGNCSSAADHHKRP